MSGGRSRKNTLPYLGSMSEQQARIEIANWANSLPVGYVGCTVRDTTTRNIANATLTAVKWTVTDFESDDFFNYDSTPEADTMVVPEGLGGMYGFQVVHANGWAGGSIDAVMQCRVTRDASTYLAYHQYTPGLVTSQPVTHNVILPRPLIPGDSVQWFFSQTSGATRTFVPSTTETVAGGRQLSPSITFYRLGAQ